MSSAGRRLLSNIVQSQSLDAIIKMDLYPELFRDSEVTLYDFIANHINTYGAVPTQGTVEEKLGDVLVLADEPAEYYLKEVEQRFLHGELKIMMAGAQDHLNAQNPEKAFIDILTRVSDLSMTKKRRSMLDFRYVVDLIYAEYMTTKSHLDGHSLLFGWESLDGMTGGLRGGDTCSIVGRPASGKTFMGLYTTKHSWGEGEKPLFISMEMTKLAIAQRMASMEAHKSLTHILKGELTTQGFKNFISILNDLKTKELPLWIVDGNLTANVDDIVTLCRQLKPSSVFIDGAYLLRHPNPRIGRWDKMTENAEGIKQRVATDLEIPVVASYQFSKEVAKKKKKGDDSKVGVEDIYGSDAIAQLSSVVLGLFEPDSVETEKRRMVNIIKGRNGEAGQFLINWDFVGMNFNEIPSKMDENGNLVTSTQGMSFLG